MAEKAAAQYPANLPGLHEEQKNLTSWVLDGDINNAVTTFAATATISFTATEGFYIRINNEIMFVELTSGSTFSTVVRGADGTTPAAHSDGDTIYHVNAANIPNQMMREIIAIAAELGVVVAGASADLVTRLDESALGASINTETLAGTKTLTNADAFRQRWDPGGASRTGTLPAEGPLNHDFEVTNAADVYSEDINMENDAAGAILTIRPGETALLYSDGTTWYGKIIANKWKNMQVTAVGPTTDQEIADDIAGFIVTPELVGWNIALPHASCTTAGITGTQIIELFNKTQAQQMLSTNMNIETTELLSSDATTPPVVDAAQDDLQLYDEIMVQVTAIQTGTAAKGLRVWVPCWKPA